MKEEHERLLYRVNAIVGIAFNVAILWTVLQHSLKHEHNVALLATTLLFTLTTTMALPFQWPDMDRRITTIVHIAIKVMIAAALVYALL